MRSLLSEINARLSVIMFYKNHIVSLKQKIIAIFFCFFGLLFYRFVLIILSELLTPLPNNSSVTLLQMSVDRHFDATINCSQKINCFLVRK